MPTHGSEPRFCPPEHELYGYTYPDALKHWTSATNCIYFLIDPLAWEERCTSMDRYEEDIARDGWSCDEIRSHKDCKECSHKILVKEK